MHAVHSLPRDSPARSLAREVLIRGPISRAELAARLNLSVASLTRLSKPLLESGLLRESEEQQASSIGRPTRPLEVSPDAHHFVGIKLTGEKAAGVATNLHSVAVASAERTLPSHSVPDVVAAIIGVISDLGAVERLSGVGISIGGKVSDDGVVLRAPFLEWRGVPLARLVASEVGLPVVLENDLVALTIAEQWFGAGRGKANFAVLTVGAGVGYGVVINDRVIAPPDAGLGLAGHYPLDAAGPLCFEGHRGCSSAVLTIPAICSQFAAATGEPLPYADILRLSQENHPVAAAVVGSAGASLGKLIAAVANLTMVECVVLSGEGMDLAEAAAEDIARAIAYYRDPEATPIQLHRQPTDFTQWARGAAAVVIQRTILGTLD